MTTPTHLPLDAAAKVKKAREELAGLCSGERKFTMCVPVDRERDTDMVISDALDVAEALAARVAELERELNGVREASASELSTAYKRVAELEAEARGYWRCMNEQTATANALRDDNEHFRKQAWERVLEANALRDALEKAMSWGIALGTTDPEWVKIAQSALAAHPAASLAAHDAEVLERAIEAVRGVRGLYEPNASGFKACELVEAALKAQALTAQAQEVKP